MTTRPAHFHLVLAGALALLAACSDDASAPADAGTATPDAGALDATAEADATAEDAAAVDSGAVDAGETPDAGGEARCTTPTAVECTDQQITQLVLYSNVNGGAVTNTATTAGAFLTSIDATAGGTSPTQSYVYVRFTETGMERVAISDEQAFDSMDWDLAFRRYVVRVNSGVGGPSCVKAARVPGTTDFASVSAEPAANLFRIEQYFATDTCDLVPDGSGLPGAAAVALGSYWTYQMCVQMTFNVFVLQLADGRDVKLQIRQYYGAAGAQDVCDRTGSVPQPSGSANFVVLWSYLP